MLNHRRPAILASAMVIVPWLAVHASAAEFVDNYPRMTRPAGLAGQAAINSLGSRLASVAQRYGWTGATLRAELLASETGRDLRLDANDNLIITETQAPAGPLPRARDGGVARLSETFALNSNPGASKTISLVFGTSVLERMPWAPADNHRIGLPAFSLDDDPQFSDWEKMQIQQIWATVAEDFAAFDVNVTTAPVNPDKLIRSNEQDQSYGMTVHISSAGVTPCGCMSSTYVGSFGKVDNMSVVRAIVNASLVEGGSGRAIGRIASHAIGHALGLRDDRQLVNAGNGQTRTELYPGAGNGTGLAPVMGAVISASGTQLGNGDFPNSVAREDEPAVIIRNGLSRRPDDVGNSRVTSAPATLNRYPLQTFLTGTGVIERQADQDVFSFNANPGRMHVAVYPEAYSARAFSVDLASPAGVRLASTAGSSVPYIQFNIPSAGTYYLVIRPDQALAPQGSTPSGNIGSYRISGEITPTDLQPPVARLTIAHPLDYSKNSLPVQYPVGVDLTFDASSSSDDGGVVSFNWDFGDGTTNAGSRVIKRFNKPGTYTVRVKAADGDKLSGFASQTIKVEEWDNQTASAR